MRYTITILILILLGNTAFASKHYDFNTQCINAYRAVIAMNFEEGKYWLDKEKQENPDNLIPYFIDSYIDCLPLLFNGNPQDYQSKKNNYQNTINILSEGPEDSPWYKYSQASVNFYWAIARIRFNENTQGARLFRRSYLLLKDNQEKFPNFQTNNILLGVEEAIIGTIPDTYRWLVSIMGMRGNLNNGIQKVKNIAQQNQYQFLQEEATFFYLYLDFYLGKQKQQVWRFINNKQLDTKNNYLYTYIVANIALDAKNANYAERVLRERNQSKAYHPVHLFHYQLGLAYLYKLDHKAKDEFQRFIDVYRGEIFVKHAYQNLTYHYLANNQRSLATQTLDSIKAEGNALFDADKQALRFAQNNRLPNRFIIRGRLKSMGGYAQDALLELGNVKVNQLNQTDRIEYFYRLGSIHRSLNNPLGAISLFTKCIEIGEKSSEQYAARSALEIAEIHEERREYAKARQYFNKCLSMKNHDFQSVIDQAAKSGLARLPR